MTLGDCVAAAARALDAAGFLPEDSRRDAAVLARNALGWDLATWLVRQRSEAPAAFPAALDAAIARRARREPVAYIIGAREFYGRSFGVTPDVLIPRPETELVVDEALRVLDETGGRTVADVGTGSGCLAVTIALERPPVSVVATDVSTQALEVAAGNARRLGASERIRLVHASLLDGTDGPFDLIVSNPPYVPTRDRGALPADVRDYEPGTALFAGLDGLDVIRALLPAAFRALAPGGTLVVEVGSGQADACCALAVAAGFAPPHVSHDLARIARVVTARKPSSV